MYWMYNYFDPELFQLQREIMESFGTRNDVNMKLSNCRQYFIVYGRKIGKKKIFLLVKLIGSDNSFTLTYCEGNFLQNTDQIAFNLLTVFLDVFTSIFKISFFSFFASFLLHIFKYSHIFL